MRGALVGTLIVVIALAGCAAQREVLLAKSAAVPAGVDFSGRWHLRDDSTDSVRQISKAERSAAGGEQKIVLPPEGRSSRTNARIGSRGSGPDGTLVHVFLETGTVLKVTQTDYALFISFDRAVVEEYRFGELREVNVGPVKADRASGWQGDGYIIETLDQDGVKLVETYGLDEDGQALVRTIVILRGESRELDVRQVFDKL